MDENEKWEEPQNTKEVWITESNPVYSIKQLHFSQVPKPPDFKRKCSPSYD